LWSFNFGALLAIRSVAVTGSDWVLPETGCKTSKESIFFFRKGRVFLHKKRQMRVRIFDGSLSPNKSCSCPDMTILKASPEKQESFIPAHSFVSTHVATQSVFVLWGRFTVGVPGSL